MLSYSFLNPQFTYVIFILTQSIIHHFTGLLRANIVTSFQLTVNLVGRALHRYRRGHGFKSRAGLNFFQALFSLLPKISSMFRIAYVVTIAFGVTPESWILLWLNRWMAATSWNGRDCPSTRQTLRKQTTATSGKRGGRAVIASACPSGLEQERWETE